MHFGKRRVKFHQIPKRAPWWGGMWEVMVGVTKRTLKKVLGRSLLELRELETLLKEVQAVVNDRPLTYVSADPLDLAPICPSQLVLGHRVTELPHASISADDIHDPDYSNDPDQVTRAQRRRSLLYGHFITRFKQDYLPALREQHIYKNKRKTPFTETVSEGQVVQIHEDGPRVGWKCAVITGLIRGPDGQVRAAELRTVSGKTNRPISKLYPLEVSSKDPEEDVAAEGPPPGDVGLRRSARAAAASANAKIHEQLNARPEYNQ